MFGVVAGDYPRLSIDEGLAVMKILVNASMYVDNDGGWELAFTLAVVSKSTFAKRYLALFLSLFSSVHLISDTITH